LELVEKINGQKSRFFAQLAGLVFDAANQGDQVALDIIKDGAEYISGLARKLLQTEPHRISIIGGLAPLLMPYLDGEVIEALSAPLAPPEVGAVYFAQAQMNYNADQQSTLTA
jgi:glucosamine kinase